MINYIDDNIRITKKLVEMGKHKRKIILERYDNQFKFVKNHIDKNFKILDIGCRDGGYLEKLKEKGYENIFGIDVSEYALKICIEKFNCYKMDIMDLGFPGKTFDYIHLSHILEHTPNVVMALRNVFDILVENGILFIEVPLQKREIYEKRDNGHFYFFEKESDLTELLENFDIIKKESIEARKQKYDIKLLLRKYK